jgi:uncharacterized membrane protein
MTRKRSSALNGLIAFMFYGMLGVTIEVCYTAIVDLMDNWGPNMDLSLKGVSYIWMIPIYGSSSFLFPLGYRMLKQWPRLLRYLAYGIGILIVELITGFLLEQTTGRCPWEYQTGWHLGGYIRFDYLPLWMMFGATLEEFHKLLQKMLHEPHHHID